MKARLGTIDAALFAFAALIGAVHLTTPFGREHALTAYVARAWLHGATPYRATLSFDAPGLVGLHAFLALLGNHGAVPLRVAALLAVLAVGALAPLVALPRGTTPAPGVRGLAACGASLFAHGYFDFWTSGRGGVFVAAALLGAAAALLRDRHALRGPLVAGALLGVALTLRTAAFPFVPLLLGVAFAGAQGGARARRVGLVLAGGAAAVGVAVLPIAAGGGLPDAYDLLWDARCVFLGEPRWETFGDLFFAARIWAAYEPVASPLAFVFLAGALRAALQRDAGAFGRAVFVAGFALASIVSLAVVGSRDLSEPELLGGLVALVVASVAQEIARLFPHATKRAHALFLAQCIFFYAISCWEIWTPPAVYGLRWRALARRVTGRYDRRAYLATFDARPLGFFPAEQWELAEWLRANTGPRDNILVRGYEPGLYLLAGRRYEGRFFTTAQLTWPNCAYKRGVWLAQDRDDLARTRPRVVVAIAGASGIDGEDSARSQGYEVQFRTAHFVALARK